MMLGMKPLKVDVKKENAEKTAVDNFRSQKDAAKKVASKSIGIGILILNYFIFYHHHNFCLTCSGDVGTRSRRTTPKA